jgi:hypothetical protein
MTKYIAIALAAASALAFAAPASANCGNGNNNGNGNGCNGGGNVPGFSVKVDVSKSVTGATGSGGVGSTSGILGGSALLGATSGTVANTSAANGVVQSTATPGQSTVVQGYQSGSVSTLQSGSLGLAGNLGGAAGVAGVNGAGFATTKDFTTSVKVH